SIRTVFLVILPDLRPSSIIEKPMRSFTLESGLKNSSLRRISACALCAAAVRFRRTSGVLPMVSVMSLWILAMVGKGGPLGSSAPGCAGELAQRSALHLSRSNRVILVERMRLPQPQRNEIADLERHRVELGAGDLRLHGFPRAHLLEHQARRRARGVHVTHHGGEAADVRRVREHRDV